MSSIDDRIVEMKFDNNAFERGVRTTLDTLAKLKDSLKFDKEKQSVNELDQAGKAFSMAGMADAVENISHKFSVLGAIGFTVIQNLTTSAMAFGKRMVGAVLNPLKEGGFQRALNIEQAKFQFRGLGMDVEKSMKSALDAVTGTAYGLDEAAKVASQFGAAGLKSGKEMTGALRGIAGAAAMTNSSFSDIGQIFTSVAGNGRLMGQQLMQFSTRGLNVAAALGKQLGKSEAEIRSLTSEGKIDFKTFAKAMDAAFGAHAQKANETYTGSLANMRAALSRIGADFYAPKIEGLKNVFNALAPAIDKVHEALQPAIDAWGKFVKVSTTGLADRISNLDFSALTKTMPHIVGAIKNVFSGLLSILKPIGAAFRDIFPAPAVSTLVSMAKAVQNFTANMKVGSETAENLRRTFRGVFAVLDIGWQIIKGLGSVLVDLLSAIMGSSGGLLNFTGNLGDFLVSLDNAIKKGGFLTGFFKLLGGVLAVPIKLLGALGELLSSIFGGFDTGKANGVANSFDNLGKKMDPLGRFGDRIRQIWSGLSSVFERLTPVVNVIADAFKKVGHALLQALGSGNFNTIVDTLNTALLGGILYVLKKFLTDGMSITADLTGGLMPSIKGSFDALTGTLTSMQTQVRAKTLMLIAGAVGLLTLSVVALSMIDSKKLTTALTAMAVGFGQLLAAMAILVKISGSAGFVKVPIISASLIMLAAAIVVLTLAVRSLSGLDWQGLAKGLVGVGALLGMIAAVVGPLSKNSAGMVRVGIGLMGIAVAMRILASAVKAFSGMSWGEIIKGLAGVAGGLAIFAGAMRLMPKSMVLQSVALIGIATSLRILANAVGAFSKLSWGSMAKGLAGVAGSLVVLAGAMMLMPKGMVLQAAALILVGIALQSLAKVLNSMGKMSWGTIAKGLITLAASLLVLGAGLIFMSGTLAGSAALAVAAGALVLFAGVMKVLGSMSWGSILKGLVALVGIFTILGVAALVLTPVVPVLLALGAAVLLVGAGMALAGVGVLAFATALSILAAAGSAAVAVAVAVVKSLIELLPEAAKSFGQALIQFVKTIGEGAPKIIKSFVSIFRSMLKGIRQLVPDIEKTIRVLIDTLLKLLIKSAPKMATAGVRIIISLLQAMSKNVHKIVKVGTDLIINFIRAIGDSMVRVVDAGVKTVIKFINGVAKSINDNAGELRKAGIRLAMAIANGMSFGLLGKGASIVQSAAHKLGSLIPGPIKSVLGINSPSKVAQALAEGVPEGMVLGLADKRNTVGDAAEELGGGVIGSLRRSIQGISDLMDSEIDMSPTIRPVLDLTQLAKDANQMNSLISQAPVIGQNSLSGAKSISADRQAAQMLAEELSKQKATGDTNIHYEQNNYSPKALSSIDIYRQTRNQLALTREALKA